MRLASLDQLNVPSPRARHGFLGIPAYYGWTLVVVAFVSAGAAFGVRAAFGVLLAPLAETLGGGRGLVTGALGLNALVAAVSAPLWGALLDRYGPRRVFASAAAILGLGLVLATLAQATWQLDVGLGVLVGLGWAPLQPNAQSVVLANWFVKRRGLAVGIVAAGSGVGVLVLAPATQWVIDRAAWQVACAGLAALFLLGIAPLNALLQRARPAAGHGPEASGQGRIASPAPRSLAPDPLVSPRPLPPGPSVRDALRARRFWALAIGMGCGALPLHFSLAHAVAHLTDVGFAPGTAAAMLGLGGAGAAAGMVLCGYLADRWNAEIVYSIGSLAFLLSLIVLARIAPGQVGLVYAYPVLLAIGFASRQSLTGVMTAALAAGRSLGAIMGVVAMCLAVGIALGPVLGGWLFDLAGSYQPAFLLAGAFAVLSTLCIWIAAPRRGSLLRPAGAVAPGAVPAHARPSAGPAAPPATIHR